VADIPGLIEGAHLGKGLGDRFLRHIERTRVLAVLIDATSTSPETDAKVLLNELAQYSSGLAERPRCVILTKSDLVPKDLSVPSGWLSMSAVTGESVETVVSKLAEMRLRTHIL
jgi:GTP-binding protein